LGAELPVNTHGGLAIARPCGRYESHTEAVKQLRGDCWAQQVTGAEIAVVSGNGGDLSTHNGLLS